VADLVLVRPMRYRVITALLPLAILGSCVSTNPYSEAAMKAMFVKMPRPEYPYDARRRHFTGNGWFRLVIDEQGQVVSVATLKSTGHPELDYSSVTALRQWQARPGARREIDVPIKYAMSGTSQGGLPFGAMRDIEIIQSRAR
jgi:TonB family protein